MKNLAAVVLALLAGSVGAQPPPHQFGPRYTICVDDQNFDGSTSVDLGVVASAMMGDASTFEIELELVIREGIDPGSRVVVQNSTDDSGIHVQMGYFGFPAPSIIFRIRQPILDVVVPITDPFAGSFTWIVTEDTGVVSSDVWLDGKPVGSNSTTGTINDGFLPLLLGQPSIDDPPALGWFEGFLRQFCLRAAL